MSNVARTYAVANVFQGPCDVYANITAPASILYPNADTHCLTLDSSGQPTSSAGFHCGSVEGPTSMQITEKCNEIMDDQHESAIDVAFDSIEGEIEFSMKETSLTRLFTLLSSSALGAYTALAATKAIQLGGQLSSAMTPVTLLLVSPDRSVSGKFIYILAYKCYLKSPVPMGFQRSKETVYKLKFGCYMDLTRVQGDELMQICRTK